MTKAEILTGIALLPAGKRCDALAAGLSLVTRNTKDFADMDGLRLLNPWQDHG
jgi:hypothetical protein